MIHSSSIPASRAGPRANRFAGHLLGAMLLLQPWAASAMEPLADDADKGGRWAIGLHDDHPAWQAQGAANARAHRHSFEGGSAHHPAQRFGDDGDAPRLALSSTLPAALTDDGAGTSAGSVDELLPYAPVPEPGTYALMLAGLLFIGLLAARQRAERR